MIKKIEHIGIAVTDLEKSEQLFEKLLGKKPYKKEKVKTEGVITSFFKIADQKLELLHATSDDSPIMKFIDKIQEYSLEIGNEDTGVDFPVINLHKNELKRVMFKDNHFVINDKQFVQLAEGSNLNNWKTLVQFQYKLKSSKIGEELINIGIKRGDLLKIGQYAFTWEE